MPQVIMAALSFLLIDNPSQPACEPSLMLISQQSSLYNTIKEIASLAKVTDLQLKLPALHCFERLLNKKIIITSYRLVFDALEEAATVLRAVDHKQTTQVQLENLLQRLAFCCNNVATTESSKQLVFTLTPSFVTLELAHD